MKGTNYGRFYERQYAFLEKHQTRIISYIGIYIVPFNYSWGEERVFKIVIINIKIGILLLCLVIYACLAVAIDSKRYLEDWLFIILNIAEVIQSLQSFTKYLVQSKEIQ